MQRYTDEGVILACDFCGTDWDNEAPMIEGHRGSIICLECLKLAVKGQAVGDKPYMCTMCRGDRDAEVPHWRHPSPGPGANAEAAVCKSCIRQAEVAFDKDPDVDFQRKK